MNIGWMESELTEKRYINGTFKAVLFSGLGLIAGNVEGGKSQWKWEHLIAKK